ncbi:MAG: ABC transporter ATP-binding protein [Clostridia bacterium]|nr:ABC transporter ATP-binding protein [Clostridia bacterium]
MSKEQNIIEINNLNKSYGQIKAVDNISFCVHKGQTFAFLGSNGAGKSTTINIICGILEKDSGEVFINGINIEKNIGEVKKKIGIVFQQSVLDKNFSVYENLKNKAILYGMSNKDFEKRLDFLSIELDFKNLLQRSIKKLSGGQARKVDLARSLIHNPKILILDEPTTGLDPQTRQRVWKFLDKLKEESGLTIFLTTHYMEEASDADYVVILDKGVIVAEDTPTNLKKKYTHDFVKIYNKRGKKEAISTLQKEGYAVSIKNEFIQLELKNTEEIKNLIIKYPDMFDDFEVIKGKMDDVFLAVTNRELEDKE